MNLVWTKSDLPLSKLIRYLSGQDCSHFAVQFDELGLVMHSNLIGVHLSVEGDFFSGSTRVLHGVHISNMSTEDEGKICLAMMEKIAGRSYAFRALFYFGWRLLLLKLFKKALPEQNAWADSRQFLCTQVYDVIPDSIIPAYPHLDAAAMVTPHALWEAILPATHAGDIDPVKT